MFVVSCLRTFRDIQSVPPLRHLEGGTESLKCPQVCETGRFCFSFVLVFRKPVIAMTWVSSIYSTPPNALRAFSCKATSYSEQEGLHVLEPVCKIRFSFIAKLFDVFLCSETNKRNTSI